MKEDFENFVLKEANSTESKIDRCEIGCLLVLRLY